MKKQLLISIKRAGESAKEFVEAWRRAEQGKPAEQPIERLYFEDLATMLKVLTPPAIGGAQGGPRDRTG